MNTKLDLKKFTRVLRCWVCEQTEFNYVYPAIFELSGFAEQDIQLSGYTGDRIAMQRCLHCGFIQPEALPTLPNYFDRLYDQHWSAEWIEADFENSYKDYIFSIILSELGHRTASKPGGARTLLDIGAHVGKFLFFAKQAGWRAEGIELNPRTSAFAAQRTGLPVHRINAKALVSERDRRYTAITLTDVLEHLPDPLQILRAAADLLEPKGWIAIKVPCGVNQLAKERTRSWLGLGGSPDHLADNLVHLSHFAPASLRLALERCGFGQITVTIGAPELADMRVEPTLAKRASNLFRRAVYRTGRFLPIGLHTPLALNLQAYAQKMEGAREAWMS